MTLSERISTLERRFDKLETLVSSLSDTNETNFKNVLKEVTDTISSQRKIIIELEEQLTKQKLDAKNRRVRALSHLKSE